MELEYQTLIVFVGTPSGGKSTVSKILERELGVKRVDIDDEVRTVYIGIPQANDGTDPEIDKRDRAEMAGSYDILFGIMEGFLHAGKSLIVTQTMSSKQFGQDRLAALCAKYPTARLRVVWCKPELSDTDLDERIRERLASGYTGGTRSAMRVRELEKRFNPIELPHLVLNTAAPNTPEMSAGEAMGYILESQSHDKA